MAVDPETTLLQAIRGAGVDVVSDCEEGYCGTCETAVLDGVPDHCDVVLSKAERAAGRTIMLCVSRAFGRNSFSMSETRCCTMKGALRWPSALSPALPLIQAK